MPEIGATLREARMRARIDISEIEAETKIRAKYLRALENEEWGLLPGPAYVRSFLRTYAEALGLDAKLLLEEYKLRHERPSDHDLMPIGAPRRRGGGRGGRGGGRIGPPREPRRIPVGVFVGLIIVLLVGALYLLGRGSGGDGGTGTSPTARTQTSRTTTTPVPASKSSSKKTSTSSKKTSSSSGSSKRVRVAIVATGPGPVFACLVDAAGTARIPGATLQEGVTTSNYRSKSFRLRLGNGNARLRVDGKLHEVPDASPVAFTISKGSVKRVAPRPGPELRLMAARAGIVVTGTEVLTGRVSDRNGPWLAERLRELGVDIAHTIVVGDRPADVRDALGWLRDAGMDLVITSGGLGPTEDDLTAQVVGEFQGRPLELDEALEGRIWKILQGLTARFPDLDEAAVRRSNRKQALVPRGATVLEPVGTAPGLVVPPSSDGGPTVLVLPGPPRELQPMWRDAVTTEAFRSAVAGAIDYRQAMLRLFGIPESEIANTMVKAREAGIDLDALEITTCLRRGEVEVVTRYEPAQQRVYDAFAELVRERHPRDLFSEDGTSVDEQVASLLRGDGTRPPRTIATAESCTGGLLAGRLTDLAGSSDYVLGGLVVYSNEAKVELAGVDGGLIASFGAVSVEVAEALADGARSALDATVGVGITGIAGPGGGTEDKPVGTVCFSVTDGERRLTRRLLLPGGRFDIRDRSTTVAMHMVRRVLRGEA